MTIISTWPSLQITSTFPFSKVFADATVLKSAKARYVYFASANALWVDEDSHIHTLPRVRTNPLPTWFHTCTNLCLPSTCAPCLSSRRKTRIRTCGIRPPSSCSIGCLERRHALPIAASWHGPGEACLHCHRRFDSLFNVAPAYLTKDNVDAR